ncbi:Long-chain-fatty-acid--CoA ligase [Stanieria cyanosphaera PCC 7437]|uniref:Long-chain-fatty-acid--CoA ligase n=1 Tax=Stanieria cyanosphaera (strain ATCC 29371 / PCC 7437) TaxID=111780 RepID=K9XMV0_STAC7|nr:long-chain fatty acid--CoA ligase [Stanieria cyanosphaera]AFZ33838.1 Long-chain-fatty-acid--CoA ligase [Stanieria cyanosphaera PCC 7437]
MNITDHIERASKLFPDKTALIFEGKSYTYQELNQLANRMANGLKQLGVTKSDRVALFLPNIPEFIISYLGILKLGAIAVSLNVMLKSSEVSFILNDCTAKVLITTEELREQVYKREIPQLQTILLAEQQIGKGISLDQIIANASPNAEAVDLNKNDPAAIVYTSGTTGFPKGATLSHGNIISNMAAQNRCCNMTSGDRILLYLPLFHCFGQNAVLNAGLNVGAAIVLQRRFKPEQVLDAILKEKITMFFGVPTVFIKLLNLNPSVLANVRYFFSAAAPMPVEIAQKWQEQYGIVIHEGYGLTETSPCACYNHNSNYKFGSIGTPIDDVEMKIVDTEGREVSPGEIGEIAIKGSNVMLGYWNRPLETAKVLKNGWFHSGDIGSMDQDGYFYIVDRLKDMINVSGFKVYPAEVENVLYQHPAVAEAAVYGIPDPFKGETVNANIVLKYGITETEMAAFCAERIATYKVPKCFKFVNSIPKNPTGKILKRMLREEQITVMAS